MINVSQLREFGFANLGLSLVWIFVVICGLTVLLNYETLPGPNPDQLAHWPTDSKLRRSTNRPLVIMFVHPHCPCTRASVSELEQIVSICHELAEFQVVVFDSEEADSNWRASQIVETVSSIPGVNVYWDKHGREAIRFNIKTSGHVVLYDSEEKLKFSGGITGSRGHAGSNTGRSRLVSWLRLNPEDRANQIGLLESPVFGCALVEGTEPAENE